MKKQIDGMLRLDKGTINRLKILSAKAKMTMRDYVKEIIDKLHAKDN